jgi:hypothetical protein
MNKEIINLKQYSIFKLSFEFLYSLLFEILDLILGFVSDFVLLYSCFTFAA